MFFLYTGAVFTLVTIGFCILYLLNSKENYFLVVRVYNVIDYSILAYFFSLYIRNRLVKSLIFFSIAIYFIFCLISYLTTKIPEMPFVPFTVEHISLLILLIYYFFEIMQDSVIVPIYQKAIFWISVAFIINSAGNFFLFLYSKNSYNDDIFKKQYTIIYTSVTVMKNLLLCIAISMKEKTENLPQNNFLDVDLDSFNPIKKQN